MERHTGDTNNTGANSTGDVGSQTLNSTFNNTGKVKARDIIISTGLNENAVRAYLDKYTEELKREMATQGHVVTTETVRELRALVESKFVDSVCDLRAEQMNSEARIKEAVQKKFEELQDNTAALFRNFLATLNGKMADGTDVHQSIIALREKAEFYAEQHYTAVMRAFEELSRKADRIQRGVDEVGERLAERDKKSETYYQKRMQYGHEALKTAQFDVAKGYFEEVTKSPTVNDDMRADAYFGMALAQWQIQLIWDESKNAEQFILYNFNIDLSEKHSPYREAIGTSEKQAGTFRTFVKKLRSSQAKLRYYQDRGLSYDCFICTKVSGDKNGSETEDCKWIKENNLYNELQKRNISPFFSETDCPVQGVEQGTLAYESLIYYALSKARIMLLVCSEERYLLESPWVDNEINRFRMFCKKRGEEDLGRIIVVYKDKPIELQSDLDVKYQAWNRSTVEVEKILKAVENAVGNAKGNVEGGWKYCPVCGTQYPSDKVACNEDRPCAGTPLVDALKWANISRNRDRESYQGKIGKLEKENSDLEEKNSDLAEENSSLKWRINALESSLKAAVAEKVGANFDSGFDYPTLENGNYDIRDFEIEGTVLKRYKMRRIDFYPSAIVVKVRIPMGVTEIGEFAFSGCRSLMSIEIPDSVTSIGKAAFRGCCSLTSIVIPGRVTSIGGYAFRACSSLTSIIIPSSVASIGEGAFYGCSSLERIEIPDSVTSIGEYAFEDCSLLESVKMSGNVTLIGKGAFFLCTALKRIDIPDGVSSIGDYAFCDCILLESITIPQSVTTIGEGAFDGCNWLLKIYCEAKKKPRTWSRDWNPDNRPVVWGYKKDGERAIDSREKRIRDINRKNVISSDLMICNSVVAILSVIVYIMVISKDSYSVALSVSASLSVEGALSALFHGGLYGRESFKHPITWGALCTICGIGCLISSFVLSFF